MRYLTLMVALSTFCGLQFASNANEVDANAYRDSLIKPYQQARTLPEAIEVLKTQLTEADMTEYLPLLTKESVKSAINGSVDSIEANHEIIIKRAKTDAELQAAHRTEKNFRELCEPIFRHIADSGKWIPASYFSFVRKEEKYAGVSINLHISAEHEIAPGQMADGYAIPILRVDYGKKPPREGTVTFK